jgi:hypothetical protein
LLWEIYCGTTIQAIIDISTIEWQGPWRQRPSSLLWEIYASTHTCRWSVPIRWEIRRCLCRRFGEKIKGPLYFYSDRHILKTRPPHRSQHSISHQGWRSDQGQWSAVALVSRGFAPKIACGS